MITLPKSLPPAGSPVRLKSLATSSAKSAAQRRAAAMRDRQSTYPLASWEDFERVHNVRVCPPFRDAPISVLSVADFAADYVASAEARLEVATAAVHEPIVPPTKAQLLDIVLTNYTPRPRQRKAISQCIDALFTHPSTSAILLPMPTGSGKTIVCAALIKYIQDNNYFGREAEDFSIIYCTPKAVEIKTLRTFARCGIKGLGTIVQVLPYSKLRTKELRAYFKDEPVTPPYGGTPYMVKKWRWIPPMMVFLDECEAIKNRETSTYKYVSAWLHPTTKWLFASATPFEKLADTYLYMIASQRKFGNELIDANNFSTAIKSIGECHPDKINNAAMSRYREWLGPALVNPPADPSKVKSFNSVMLADFPSAESRARYARAEAVMIDTWHRLGKVVGGRGEMLAALTAFQAAEEFEKADVFADLITATLAEGRAPVIGVKFLGTIKKLVGILAKRGYTRADISIIMGGEREIKESDVYTTDEFLAVHTCVCEKPGYLDDLPRAEATKYRKSVVYHRERWKNFETPEEQRDREHWLSSMKLRAQDAAQRQDEIDNFQEGRTTICIFTLKAGGVGVDLDQQIETVRPRTMFATICWSGREFVQAFGRCKREFTLTNVYQHAVFFRNTIVADRIAPRLSSKLASINKLGASGIDLEGELLDAIDKAGPAETIDTSVVEDADTVIDDNDFDPEDL